MSLVSVGALGVAALALAHVLTSWTVVFFYVVPGVAFGL